MGRVVTARDGWSVGAAAAELGLAPETLRSYGRRYGLLPSARTAGGHRRYTPSDLDRLVRMQQLITGGLTPARAAAAVLSPAGASDAGGAGDAGSAADRTGTGPGGRVLAVPGARGQVRGLARAVSRLDGESVTAGLLDHLTEHGAVRTWEEAALPLLIAVGERYGRSGAGIDLEHVLSESVIDAFRRYRAAQRGFLSRPPVLLASAPEDQHVLPLFAVAAALAEQRVPHLLLGARVPYPALDNARRRTGARAVFVWHQIDDGCVSPPVLRPSRPPVRLVVGGPGWAGVELPPGGRRATTLREALEFLVR